PSGGRAVDRGRGRPRDPPADGGDRGPRTLAGRRRAGGGDLVDGRRRPGPRVGEGPPRPLGAPRGLGAMAPALRAQVARVLVLLDGTLELRLRGGPTIRFGTPEDAERKAVTIRRMLSWAGSKGTALRTLSVVSALAPAATFVDPA